MLGGSFLSNIVLVLILFGGPLLPLLIIAFEVEHWHRLNPDPPFEEELKH